MGNYVFKKKGFKYRQSERLMSANKRQAIMIDAHINSDPKVELLHSQRDYTLMPTYIEILCNLDQVTEEWEISEASFKNWFRKKFQVNNRFRIEERLEWLSNAGLIEFKRVSNDVLTTSLRSNKPEVYPLEQAETQALTDPYITNTIQPKQPTQTARECDEKYGEIAKQGFEYLRAIQLPNLNLSGLEKRLAYEFDKYHQVNQHLKREHLLECWMASCDVLRAKQDISSLNYVFNTFKSKLASFEPAKAIIRPQAQTPKQEHWQIISQSSHAVNLFDGSVIDGTQYVYDCMRGLDARLRHKQTGETIRCGDYRKDTG